jgi:hypothetical protein
MCGASSSLSSTVWFETVVGVSTLFVVQPALLELLLYFAE